MIMDLKYAAEDALLAWVVACPVPLSDLLYSPPGVTAGGVRLAAAANGDARRPPMTSSLPLPSEKSGSSGRRGMPLLVPLAAPLLPASLRDDLSTCDSW
jgi:hypothetical protein